MGQNQSSRSDINRSGEEGEENAVFFVCGTPANKVGFEYACIDGHPLPGTPGTYLDRLQHHELSPSATHVVRIETDTEGRFALYAEYRAIHPSDSASNRGAYIAAGFLSAEPLSIAAASTCLARVSDIHADLKLHRPDNDAFRSDFQISQYVVGKSFPVPQEGDSVPDMLSYLIHLTTSRIHPFENQATPLVLTQDGLDILNKCYPYLGPEVREERMHAELRSVVQKIEQDLRKIGGDVKGLHTFLDKVVKAPSERVARWRETRGTASGVTRQHGIDKFSGHIKPPSDPRKHKGTSRRPFYRLTSERANRLEESGWLPSDFASWLWVIAFFVTGIALGLLIARFLFYEATTNPSPPKVQSESNETKGDPPKSMVQQEASEG